MRRDIAERKLRVLRWPADKPCPVEKGQRFKVSWFEIEIETINRKIVKGAPAEWHATFIRHEPDRYNFLRQAPPVHAGSEKDLDLDISAAERARRDGNYTASLVSSVPHEPESVGPDWIDPHIEEREERRRKERKEIERQRANAQVHAQLGRILKELDESQWIAMLAFIERACEQAKRGELNKEAA